MLAIQSLQFEADKKKALRCLVWVENNCSVETWLP